MANQDHLKILLSGVEAWNSWRAKNHNTVPDLEGANLQAHAIQGFDLAAGASHTKRFSKGANLRCANLSRAMLAGAKLNRATLVGAQLEGADLRNTDLSEACLFAARLSHANISGANLDRCNLSATNLSRVKGLTDEQIANSIGNFQSVRLPYTISKMPSHWTECRDGAIPAFDHDISDVGAASSIQADSETVSATANSIETQLPNPIPSNPVLGYTRELLIEIRKKSQSSIAAGLIGFFALAASEVLSITVLGRGWLGQTLELVTKLSR